MKDLTFEYNQSENVYNRATNSILTDSGFIFTVSVCTVEFSWDITLQRGYNTYPNEADPRVPVAVWATCAYTIQCLGKH